MLQKQWMIRYLLIFIQIYQPLFMCHTVHYYCPSCVFGLVSQWGYYLHLLIHWWHRAANAGSWGNEASRSRTLRDSVRGTAERRPSSELWPQLHWLTWTVDLHHTQVRVISDCLPLYKFNLKKTEPQKLGEWETTPSISDKTWWFKNLISKIINCQ